MDDIQLEFAPSKLWCVFLLFFYFAGLLYIILQALPLLLELFLVSCMALTATYDIYTLLRQQKTVSAIKCHQESWYVCAKGQWIAANISLYFQSPFLMIVCYQGVNTGVLNYRCIWRDALTTRQWCKLRIYLSVCC